MLLLDNERRAQKLTADEFRPRLPFWVKSFYTQVRVGSKSDYPVLRSRSYGFAMGISNCR